MTTVAIHRVRPTMINPVRHPGRSGSNSQAKANISAGPAGRTDPPGQEPVQGRELGGHTFRCGHADTVPPGTRTADNLARTSG
jgi:hypothetical protein